MTSDSTTGQPPPVPCPGCGAQMSIGAAQGKRRYLCEACGGLLIGIAVFRDVAGRELAQHIWASAMAAADTTGAGPCPFCTARMHPAASLGDVGAGAAGTAAEGKVWACKTCEMAFLDTAALAAIHPQAGAAADAAPGIDADAGVAKCPNCGAPVSHTWDEACAFCGAALHPATKVVILGGEPSDYADRSAGPPSVFRAAARILGDIADI